MLTASQVAEFNRNGCLVAPQPVISDSEVEELRGELDRVLARAAKGFAPEEAQPVLVSKWSETPESILWQVVNIWEASTAFRRLLHLPFVVKAISQLTGQPDLMIWHDQIQYKPPFHGGINNWHQDAPLWPILRPETPVTAWIALDEVDESNGCMWMVPGSHKWGNHIDLLMKSPESEFLNLNWTPPGDAEINTFKKIPWPVKKGHVSFHHSMTWHGSHKNKSDRPRRAIAIHFMTGQARFVASGQHVMKRFVELPDGAPMSQAGAHFPVVCKDGEPVRMPG